MSEKPPTEPSAHSSSFSASNSTGSRPTCAASSSSDTMIRSSLRNMLSYSFQCRLLADPCRLYATVAARCYRQNHFGQPSSMRVRTIPDAKNPPSHNSNRTPDCNTSPKSSGAIMQHRTMTESPTLNVLGVSVYTPTVFSPSTPSIRIGTRR